MRINLFTTTLNNEDTIKSFIDFYKERIPNIIITIWDKGSSDKTIEIVKEENCIIKNYNDFYNDYYIWKNNCWKYIPTDTIVLVEIDEYLDIPYEIFNNCTLIQSKGYDIKNLSDLELTDEKRNILYDKFCIFDAQTIREMNFSKDGCNPIGFVLIGEKKPILYHLLKSD